MCFSMYSDMSSRTIARSSSNMNSASAFASSVFPTPVGPRKTNEPIGRFGSCRPERARRSAFETASIAASWPTTRWCSRASMCTSFCTSPSRSRSTGIFVQAATTAAMSSSSTSSFTIGSVGADRLAALGELLLERGQQAVADLGDALEIAVALGPLGLHAQLVDLAA